MKSKDDFMNLITAEKSIEKNLIDFYDSHYSDVKDDYLKLKMRELILLIVGQIKITEDLVKYIDSRNEVEFLPLNRQSISNKLLQRHMPSSLPDFNSLETLLVDFDPSKYSTFLLDSMQHMLSNGCFCIYVSATKTSESLKLLFKGVGLDISKICFIECSSALDIPGSISPGSLTELNIRITESLGAVEGKKIVVLDTLSALLVYNDKNTLTEFLSILSKRAKTKGFGLLMLHLHSKDQPIDPVIQTLADKVLHY